MAVPWPILFRGGGTETIIEMLLASGGSPSIGPDEVTTISATGLAEERIGRIDDMLARLLSVMRKLILSSVESLVID